jgi:Flp pilus assembly protein TadD
MACFRLLYRIHSALWSRDLIRNMQLFFPALAIVSFLLASSRPPAASPAHDAALVPRTLQTARKLIQEGKIVDALRQLAILDKQAGHDPEVQLALGELFQELSASRAEQLQQVAPDSAAAHELLGKSYEARGKLSEALSEYEHARDSNPREAGLNFLLGNLEWKLKNTEAAERDLRKELELNPHHAMANLRLGQILLVTDRDNPDHAIAYLKEAATDAASSLEAHRELGKALRISHQYSEAVKELKLVEQERPNDDSVHAQLAALYRDLGDTERARIEIELHARILRERLQASQDLHSQHVP